MAREDARRAEEAKLRLMTERRRQYKAAVGSDAGRTGTAGMAGGGAGGAGVGGLGLLSPGTSAHGGADAAGGVPGLPGPAGGLGSLLAPALGLSTPLSNSSGSGISIADGGGGDVGASTGGGRLGMGKRRTSWSARPGRDASGRGSAARAVGARIGECGVRRRLLPPLLLAARLVG